MSHSTYYLFDNDGGILEKFEMGNGWGSSPVIWGYLCKKYIGPQSIWLMDLPKIESKEILARMDPKDRFLFYMTCDRTVLPRAEFLRAATLIEAVPIELNQVSHWPSLVKVLRARAEDERVLGFGIQATSVSDNLWEQWSEKEERTVVFDARQAWKAEYEEKERDHEEA